MANFYTDNPDLRHHLTHPMMRKIVALKERDYSQAQQYDYAPVDYDDAIDNYDRVLQIVGDLCGNIIADNAADVDHDGPSVSNGRVTYAPGTIRNLEACRQAGLMGMAMPRRLGGLNFPITPYIMAADIVSRADTGFENLWGLQDCAETLYEFGSEDQKQRFIPRVCAGETMSMDLTEPDAGSDLQAVMLKATKKRMAPGFSMASSALSPTVTATYTWYWHEAKKAQPMAAVYQCSSMTSATAESMYAASKTRWASKDRPHAN